MNDYVRRLMEEIQQQSREEADQIEQEVQVYIATEDGDLEEILQRLFVARLRAEPEIAQMLAEDEAKILYGVAMQPTPEYDQDTLRRAMEQHLIPQERMPEKTPVQRGVLDRFIERPRRKRKKG